MARKKITAIMWSWRLNKFWVRHADGTHRAAKKREKLPSGAIARALEEDGKYVPIGPYRLTARDRAWLRTYKRMKA